MGLVLDRLFQRSAPQSAYGRPGSWATYPLLSRLAATGANVTVDTAMELVPVYGAVSMLAGAIGSLPMKVYRDTEPRQEALGSRQWRMLHDQPNDEIAADEFWEIITASLLLWGNAFVYKERNDSGVVQNLWPMKPSRVQVGRESNPDGSSTRFFRVDGTRTAFDTDILHIRGISYDGVVGLSPVQQARQQMANGTAFEEFQGTFLKNGLFPSLIFTHPNRLSNDAKDRLNEDIKNRSSWLAAGEVPVLDEGAELKSLSMPLVDAQFVEQANLGDHRVAQLFGLVPPHQWGVGAAGKSMTYTNSEFGGLEFVKWSVRKWLVRIENSVRRDPGIFPAPGPVLFPEFIVDALLRSDTLSRYQAYEIGIRSGFLSVPGVQAIENISPDDAQLTALPELATPQDGSGNGQVQGQLTAGPTANGAPRALESGQRTLEMETEDRMRQEVELRSKVFEPTPWVTGVLESLRHIFQPEIRVDVAAAEVRNEIRQLTPDVQVSVDMQPVATALDRLTEAVLGKELAVNVEAPVTVPQVPVQLTLLEPPDAKKTVTFQRDKAGKIKSAEVTEE